MKGFFYLRASIVCAALGLGVAVPTSNALAGVPPLLSATLPASVTIATVQFGCPKGIATSLSQGISSQLSVSESKRAAIVGGELSALDRIRLQQATWIAPAGPAAAPLSSETAEMAISSLSASAPELCRGRASEVHTGGRISLPTPFTEGEFLASRRIKISRTSFDKDWRRVRTEKVSKSFQRRFSGDTGVNRKTLQTINSWVNETITYVEDRELFGRSDFWAGARKTLVLHKGDCEDIAITKMQLLAVAGFKFEDMFLTIARDKVLMTDHALLVVKIDGQFVILDNVTDEILDGAFANEYQPILSFNDRTAWVHGY